MLPVVLECTRRRILCAILCVKAQPRAGGMAKGNPMSDRTTTTAPDATAIEEALLRIRVAADIVDTIGEALTGEAHANTLILMASDLEHAVETIRPVVQYLIENRRAAA